MHIHLRRIFFGSLAGAMCTFLAVSTLAAPQSPEEVFGFRPGDDYKLAGYDQMLAYYRQLAAESDRVQIRQIGESALGRPLLLLTISSEANLADLDRYRDISMQLARARVDEDTAIDLANQGKAVVWIDAGLHATEVAHAQMAPLLAHRVATEESAEMRMIRDNVIFLLMPGMNPDGLEIVRQRPLNNYLRYLVSGGLNFRPLLPEAAIPLLRCSKRSGTVPNITRYMNPWLEAPTSTRS